MQAIAHETLSRHWIVTDDDGISHTVAGADDAAAAIAIYAEAQQSSSEPPTPPATCTAVQGRLALLNAGLLDEVTAIIGQLPENDATRIYWEYSTIWHRDNDLISGLGATVGLSDEQIDGLFAAAQAI